MRPLNQLSGNAKSSIVRTDKLNNVESPSLFRRTSILDLNLLSEETYCTASKTTYGFWIFTYDVWCVACSQVSMEDAINLVDACRMVSALANDTNF